MKKIVIYLDDSKLLTLLDDDSTNIELYSKEISKILESSKVCILETTSGNVLIKPSKISSIYIVELSEGGIIDKNEIEIKIDSPQDDIIKD